MTKYNTTWWQSEQKTLFSNQNVKTGLISNSWSNIFVVPNVFVKIYIIQCYTGCEQPYPYKWNALAIVLKFCLLFSPQIYTTEYFLYSKNILIIFKTEVLLWFKCYRNQDNK